LKLPRWARWQAAAEVRLFHSTQTAQEENSIAGSAKSRVDLEKMRAEYEKFRDSDRVAAQPTLLRSCLVDNDRENE